LEYSNRYPWPPKLPLKFTTGEVVLHAHVHCA
jgi:hypothetical protein